MTLKTLWKETRPPSDPFQPAPSQIKKKFFFSLFRTGGAAYGGFQVRGRIGFVGAGLRLRHCYLGSELGLQPEP